MPGALLPDDPNTPAAKTGTRQQNLTHFAFLPRVTGMLINVGEIIHAPVIPPTYI